MASDIQSDSLAGFYRSWGKPRLSEHTDTTHLSFHCSALFFYQNNHQSPFSFFSFILLSAVQPFTHSSESRSFSNLFLSLKQPKECMLSSTSGSISSAEGRLRMVTFLGTGCSGSGSFLPPLLIQRHSKRNKDNISGFGCYCY